ncbi:MAG: PilZ domain-containing protein [Thermoanaerobaculia bacterium]
MIQKEDRRQSSRYEGEFRKCWSPSPGVILDVSPAGLSIETVKGMKPGEWIFVNTRMGGKKVGIPGEVRWIRQVASTRIGKHLSPVYHVGISVFSDDVQPEWHELVEECASEPASGSGARQSTPESQPNSSSGLDAAAVDSSSD